MVIAQLPGFPVCGIHYIWLCFLQMEKQNHKKSCDPGPVWVKSYVLNHQSLCFKIQIAISGLQKQIYCHIRVGFLASSKIFSKADMSFQKTKKNKTCLLLLSCSASRSVSILSCLSCASVAIFHSFAAVSRMQVLQCHSPTSQLNSLGWSKRKWMLLMLRRHRVNIRKWIQLARHMLAWMRGRMYLFTQLPCLPESPSFPGRPLWPCQRKSIYVSTVKTWILAQPVLCTGALTFGPGGPWMPGCPCIHLQDALPAVRPISAYPPHCDEEIGDRMVLKFHTNL